MTDEINSLDNFSGTARLFPLPNLVLFPAILQPLHIFEPRYRQMTQDALDDDRLIAMALLQAGWESEYQNAPPIHPVVCVSRILTDQRLEDGRFNILIRGIKRARIRHELPTARLYRSAEVELLDDSPFPEGEDSRQFCDKLLSHVPAWFPGNNAVLQQFEKLLHNDIPLGMFCDILTFALPVPAEFKQELLNETDVERRVRSLLQKLESKTKPDAAKKFPPEFSPN